MGKRVIEYYMLEKHSWEIDKNIIASAALWCCGLCERVICEMGGPGNGELCVECGRKLASLHKVKSLE